MKPNKRTVVSLLIVLGIILGMRWHSLGEPLDCDEAVYAYIGQQMAHGKLPYIDATDNKPPLAYGLFAAAVLLGGYNEWSIHLLAFPFVCLTAIALWGLGSQMFGPKAAFLSAGLYAIASSDPFLFADSSNLEIFLNPLLVGSFWAAWSARDRRHLWIVAGVLVSLATMIKQTTLIHLALYLLWVMAFPGRRWRNTALLGLGFSVPWGLLLSWSGYRGYLDAMLQALFVYGPALASASTPELWSERLWMLVAGREDGSWWGTGTWPVMLLALIGLGGVLLDPATRSRMGLLLAYQFVCLVEVFLPGMFWQHYFLLLLPGWTLLASPLAGDVESDRQRAVANAAKGPGWANRICVLLGVIMLAFAQWFYFIRLSPEQIMTEHKGGEQWVLLRTMGGQLRQTLRSPEWQEPQIFVWGIQAPLYFYSGLEAPTAKFFTDPLQQRYVNRSHPVLDPVHERIVRDLYQRPPEVVFVGEPPFRELEQLLTQRYTSATSQSAVSESQKRGVFIRNDFLEKLSNASNHIEQSPTR